MAAAVGSVEKLNSLINNGTIKKERVAWGNGFRDVVIIDGKQHQFNGKSISKLLENKISSLYIDMPSSSHPSTEGQNTNVSLKFIATHIGIRVDQRKFQEFIDDYKHSQDTNSLHQGLNVEYRITVKYKVHDDSRLEIVDSRDTDWRVYKQKQHSQLWKQFMAQ